MGMVQREHPDDLVLLLQPVSRVGTACKGAVERCLVEQVVDAQFVFDVTRASALPTHWSTFVGFDPEVMSCPPFAAGATGMKLLSRLVEIGLIRLAGIALPGKGVF